MRYFMLSAARLSTAAILIGGLSLGLLGACGKSAEDIAAGFGKIEKGTLATEVRALLGDPERIESSPQIPDLEHWKYNGGRFTVSLLQGRVLGKFDTSPSEPALPVLDQAPESGERTE